MTTETAVMPVSTTFPGTPGYLTIITIGEAAPRPDGKNLLIKIEIDRDTARFHCQDPEHVGTHKPRKVTFLADKKCTLEFGQKSVFGKNSVQLTANKPATLEVADGVNRVGTDFRIPDPTTIVAKLAVGAMNAPKIVVP
jgi:hypothetical protein